jgi:hypothetical protein
MASEAVDKAVTSYRVARENAESARDTFRKAQAEEKRTGDLLDLANDELNTAHQNLLEACRTK